VVATRTLYCSFETPLFDHSMIAIASEALENFEFQQHEYLCSNF
jgi:hypothetical protein